MILTDHSDSQLRVFYATDLRLSYNAFKAKWRIGKTYEYAVPEKYDTVLSRLDYIKYLTDKRRQLAEEYVEMMGE